MATRVSRFVPLTDLMFSLGTWTLTAVSNIMKQRKSAADQTPVVKFQVLADPDIPHGWYRRVSSVEVPYTVGTAALDAAPTSVVRLITLDELTGVLSTATLTTAQAIRGLNATGTANGDYILLITFDPVDLANNQYLQVEVTIDAAATTVLDIGSPRINGGA